MSEKTIFGKLFCDIPKWMHRWNICKFTETGLLLLLCPTTFIQIAEDPSFCSKIFLSQRSEEIFVVLQNWIDYIINLLSFKLLFVNLAKKQFSAKWYS